MAAENRHRSGDPHQPIDPDAVPADMLAQADGELTEARVLLDELIDTWRQRQREYDLADIRDPSKQLSEFLYSEIVMAFNDRFGPEAIGWTVYALAVAIPRLAERTEL